MPHPHQSLLDEFKWAIDHLPPTLPAAEKERVKETHAALLSNSSATESEVRAVIITLGRVSWPYRKAFEVIHERYGKEKEAELFRGHLSPALRKKYDAFPVVGLSIHDIPKQKDFELYFDAEEKFQIQEATFEAHEGTIAEVAASIDGPRNGEYQIELATWQEKQARLLERIAELRALADRSDRWAPEILDKVQVFEEGWALLLREPNEQIIAGEIDYYRNSIEGL